MKGGNEIERLKGTCRPVDAGSALNCDIYNGLTKWRVKELVIRVAWPPYSNEDMRDYRQRVSIAPLSAELTNIRLGTHLRGVDWSWFLFSAKGVPEGTPSN